MSPLPGTRVALATALATAVVSLMLSAPVHAEVPLYLEAKHHAPPPLNGMAPREEGKKLFNNTPHVERPRPRIDFTLGQPVQFPRELLPYFFSERDYEIEEPGTEPANSPREWATRLSQRGERTIIGPDRLINDPNGDPLGSTQSENSIAARGR